MQGQHIHTGFVTMVTITVYAIIGINLVRLASARLAAYPPTEGIGTVVGGLVKF